MKNRTKFLLALSLIAMLTALFAISVCAQTPVETWDISATSSDSVTAYLYNDTENSGYYNLTVSGTGNMKGWTFYNAPWYSTYGSKIKSVVINNGVTNIGKCAFYYCTSIANIKIPNSVTNLGDNSLERCTSLKSVVIPNSVKSINNWALKFCTGLESVTIPESVTSIGNESFYNCTALTEINFNATSMADLATGNNVFYNAGKNGNGITVTIGKNVTKIPERLLCPDSNTTAYSPKVTRVIFESGSLCTSIGQSAFNQCAHLQKINIPDSITSIGHWAFQNCTSLTSVSIPANLKTIGYHVFTGCTAITEIKYNAVALSDIPDEYYIFNKAGKNGNGITVTIGKNVTRIPSHIFCPISTSSNNSPYIIKVIFEANSQCTSIGQSAFNQCVYLQKIDLPDSITSINNWAFHGCTSLTSVSIPANLKTIGYHVFTGCTAITEIKYNAVALSDIPDEYYVFKNAGKNGSGITVTIGKNVTRIPSYIFCPVSTSKISPKITSVIFEANSQCASIGASAFMHCDYLTMIRLPKSIARIEKCAFNDCDSLTEIIFEEGSSLVSLGEDSFCNCTALKNVVLPRTLTTMYRGVFYNTALEKIVIPNTVTTMGKYVFECCDSLTIYAEATSKPSKWDSEWNSHNRPVVWDYKNTIKNDVFTFKGYSFNESGSMAYGYDIDYEAKVLYEELTGDILEMGVVFAAYDNLGGLQPLDSNGQAVTISIGKVVKANINSYEYTYYDFILTDIDDSIKDVKFVISAYLYDGEAVKYVQENSLSNTVTGKSYNEAKESVAQ